MVSQVSSSLIEDAAAFPVSQPAMGLRHRKPLSSVMQLFFMHIGLSSVKPSSFTLMILELGVSRVKEMELTNLRSHRLTWHLE